jgi:hypothetical protein
MGTRLVTGPADFNEAVRKNWIVGAFGFWKNGVCLTDVSSCCYYCVPSYLGKLVVASCAGQHAIAMDSMETRGD